MNEGEETTRLEGSDDQPAPTYRVAEPAPNTIYRLDEFEREMETVTDQLDGLIKRYAAVRTAVHAAFPKTGTPTS